MRTVNAVRQRRVKVAVAGLEHHSLACATGDELKTDVKRRVCGGRVDTHTGW